MDVVVENAIDKQSDEYKKNAEAMSLLAAKLENELKKSRDERSQ